MIARSTSSLLLLTAVLAQDPAQGWLGYAKAVSPSGHTGERITYAEATWTNLGVPKSGGAFYSPWFGIETSDNLNLFQPVNPWVGNGWEAYIEYFQWSPENNINSRAGTVRPGEILYGNVTYLPESNSYKSVHTSSSGWSVSMTIPVQGKKNYTIFYVVFEKAANCDQYPPEGKVLFTDIKIEYEGVAVTPTWTTGIVDDVCNNRAHIVNSTAVSITWDTNGANPSQELIEAHRRVGMQPRERAA